MTGWLQGDRGIGSIGDLDEEAPLARREGAAERGYGIGERERVLAHRMFPSPDRNGGGRCGDQRHDLPDGRQSDQDIDRA